MSQDEIEADLERLHPAAYTWALSCAGRNREEAQDVLQESYLRVLGGQARFRGGSSFKTFLFGVIRRTASARRRREALRRVLALRFEGSVPGAAPVPPLEPRVHLLAALAKLSRRQRAVLELVFYQDLTVEEAAGVLSISVGSARTHYARGKARLARLLSGERE